MMFYRLFTFALILFFAANPCHAGFSGYLKADTAATIKIGPFVDDTDGNTAETALTISQADVRLSKNAGDFAQKTQVDAATHDELGYYNCSIDTTDTNTEGRLKIVVHESGALLVEQSYQIVNANVYDSLYAVAATDYLQTDTLQLGGTTQSATDLKDFADAGYDPATDKVQGVVLTDTCTTNTDLVSAASVVNEWETQSQADPTGFHVNLLEIGGTAQTANDNGADINAILVDTAAVDTTTEMRTFLTGADTVVSTVTTAQVNTEADTALSDIHLDHLLAVNYDPASKPGVATALLNELIEDDVGVSRYTSNALENASGSGATAEQVRIEMDSNSTQLSAIVLDTGTTLDTLIKDIPTVAEFEARSIVSADYVVVGDTIAGVTLVTTCTTNTDMRGTDSANTTTPPTVGAIADQVWDEVLTGATHNVGSSGGKYLREMFDAGLYEEETAQAGGAETITLAATASALDDFYNLSTLTVIDGTGAGQMRTFKDYNGTTKVATACMPWVVVPDNTSKYVIKGCACAGVFQMQDSVYDLINAEADSALSDYDPPTKAEMDTAHGLLATPAQVNTEVSDVIKTDTISELSAGAPDATPTLEDALMLLYMKERNKTQTTASEFRITNDAGTVITESDLSDNGTTFEKSEQRAAN